MNGFGQTYHSFHKNILAPDNKYMISPLANQKNTTTAEKRNIGDQHSVWINFASILADFTASTLSYNTMLLFPDTNVLVRYVDVVGGKYVFTYDYSSWCSVGEALNPYSDYIGLTNLWDKQAYKVDSISFFYIYERFGANTIPDTLILQVYKPAHLENYTYSADTSPAFAVAHFDRTKVMGKNADYTLKIPFGISDTATFSGGYFRSYQFALPANFEITNGGPVGFTMTFKPGIAHKLNDTIPLAKYDSVAVSKPLNAFFCATYWDDSKETVKEYNNGMVINGQNRYSDYSTDFADGAYLGSPMWNSTTSKPWYLATWFKISYTETSGINTLSNDISANIYPNPVQANGQVNVNLKLDNARNISIAVYDLPGHLITMVPDQNYNAGNHIISIPANKLCPGLYVVKVSNDGTYRSFKLRVE